MIERSHRRKMPSAKPDPETMLRLHERLASQRLWFFRLFIASGLALVVSLILWLFRVPLLWHLSGIALGFIAGLFLQHSMKAWALAWIREQAGLSYETALEQHSKEQNQQDEFGFSASLKERAVEEASRLTLPKYQAWWLPMLAVALGLAFLPLIPSITNLPSPLTTQPTATTLPETTNQTANTVDPSQPQQTSEPVAEPPPDGQAPSQETSGTDTSQLSDANSSSSASSDTQSADEQALDQFLENLRQNEPPQEQAPDVDLSSVMQPSGGRGGQASDEDRASRPRSEQTNPFSQAGENESGEAQQNQQAQNNAENTEGEQDQQGQEQQGQEQGQENGEQQAQSQEGQEGAEDASSETSQEGTDRQPQQGEGQQAEGEQGQEGAGESGMNGEAQSADRGSDSGQNAEGAGSLPGSPAEGTSEELAGSSQQNPDFLPGQVGEGPNNIAGTARLPGETEELVFPQGSAPGSFSRAEEEALTEGRIPLEYQEVIRNYFRGE
jgi:hypothetical protein